MLSEGASERLQLKLDAQIHASRSELARIEEIKKLQADGESLKTQLNGVIEKYNALVLRHVQHKARRKAQVRISVLFKIRIILSLTSIAIKLRVNNKICIREV